jgi:hypothetical protein
MVKECHQTGLIKWSNYQVFKSLIRKPMYSSILVRRKAIKPNQPIAIDESS